MHHERPDWDIVPLLDEYAVTYNFPILNSVDLDLAGIRLTAFRSPEEWLIAFEEIGVFRHQSFTSSVFAYGNELSDPGIQESDDVILGAPQGAPPLWDDTGSFQLDPHDFRIRAGHSGKEYRFTPSPQAYRQAGVDLDSTDNDSVKILRFLTRKIPTEIYATDDRLLHICKKGEPLTRFLQLDGWRHPDIAEDELPSDSSCFQSLARALMTGDPATYECRPEEWNTHWSAWPSV